MRCPPCAEKYRQEAEAQRIAKRREESTAELPSVIEKQGERWLRTANLPAKFLYASFKEFKSSLQPLAFAAVKGFLAEDSPQSSIVLLSPDLYGLGKTHLLCALANEIIKTFVVASITKDGFIKTWPGKVYYTTETALLSRIRATFNRRDEEDEKAETENQVYDFLHRIEILMIDDVGKVRPHDTSFLQSVYFNIIDGRYTSEMPVIMASNLSPAEFEAHVGGACADRLREMCGKNIIVMKGQSYRLRGVKAG